MIRIEWSDEYCVDGGIVDQEHRSLFELANRIFAQFGQEPDRRTITELVMALFRYMEHHFRHEEELMGRIGYPQLAEHTRCHHQISDNMTHLLRTTRDLKDYASQLQHAMFDWVLTHVINEDRQVGTYLKSRRRGASVTGEPLANHGSLPSVCSPT